jgi:hypothetical protein
MTGHGHLRAVRPPFFEPALRLLSGGQHSIALVYHVRAPDQNSRHYYSELPQLIFLLLKNRSLLRGISYALFKR